MKLSRFIALSSIAVFALTATVVQAQAPQYGTVDMIYTEVPGIGPEPGVMRRDPSDIIKVGDLYYVWYSRGPIAPGYDATVWYATSPDGLHWKEQSMALPKGAPGAWDGASVFTPNILVAEGRYWLFYTGTSNNYSKKPFNPDSKIGIAVSDSPHGPWERLPTNPALINSNDSNEFDSHLVDDACLIVRDGKYWLYYKGRQQGKSPAQTKMGVAIANIPEGPYIKYENNPVVQGNHEILVWPKGEGVAVMMGTTGPKDIRNSILYSADGLNFTKTHSVKDGPVGGGGYRPEAYTDSNLGEHLDWGLELQYPAHRGGLPYLQRWDAEWSEK